MESIFKPDFDQCLDRVEAWWARQIIDRPPVSLSVHGSKKPRPVPAHHSDIRQRWLDVEYNLQRAEANIESTVYLAESFPRFMPNLGPEVCATTLGCDLKFAENTSWSVPCATDIRHVLSKQPDLDTTYWNIIRRMTELSAQRGGGKWITGVTDLHTNADLLASLRDPENLALDYADDLEGVQLACRHVTPWFSLYFDDLYRRAGASSLPCSTWGIALSRGRCYYVSCDFICMISPAMFAVTVLPAIAWECDRLEHSIFHLDGPGALKHLDALLALPRLDAIQWTYGAGQGPAAKWIEVYQRIQRAGKGMEVHIASLDDARTIMENLRPEGVWMSLGSGMDMDSAQAFLRDVERWARKH